MGARADRLLYRLAAVAHKVYVPPYVKADGTQVDGHWRKMRPGEQIIPVVAHPKVSELLGMPSEQPSVDPPELVAIQGGKANVEPVDCLDLQDQRDAGEPPLVIDREAMNTALMAAGVNVGPNTKIKLRLRTSMKQRYGSAQKIGPDSYRVVVYVTKGKGTKDSHLYVINNSVIHELRHVRQHQDDPQHSFKYAHAEAVKGYWDNPYEIEAREYGRLADELGTRTHKGLPKGKKPLGKLVWGLRPAGV